MLNVFIIIGHAACGKSSLIRALSGASRRKVYRIENEDSVINKTFVQVRSLQEAKISPENFVSTINSIEEITQILVALRIQEITYRNRLTGEETTYPDGEDYINYFTASGWRINDIVELSGETTDGSLSTPRIHHIRSMSDTYSRASNEIASVLRSIWKWK